jgi:hypothetical protein
MKAVVITRKSNNWVECCNPDCVACDVPEPPVIPTAQACVLCPEVKALMQQCRVFLDHLDTLYDSGNPTVKQAIAMERALRKLERAGIPHKPVRK